MARGVLILGAVTCVGCVIPTSLQVVQQPANYPPVFVTDLCTPPLEGPITPGTMGTSPIIAPHLVIDDIDAANGDSTINHDPEHVFARIFKLATGTGALLFMLETKLSNANPLTPTRYVGDFVGNDWCQSFFSSAGEFDIVVIVADRDFQPIGSAHPERLVTDDVDGGIPDGGASVNESQSGWRLHCQQ